MRLPTTYLLAALPALTNGAYLLPASASASTTTTTTATSTPTSATHPRTLPYNPLDPTAAAAYFSSLLASATATASATPTLTLADLANREVVAAVTTTQASQMDTVTTEWVETTLSGGSTTWVPVVYTQTFASVVDQGASPGSGHIGLATGKYAVTTTATETANGAALGRGVEGWVLGGLVLVGGWLV